VEKEIRSIPEKDQIRLLKGIYSLAENPRPHGCKKLVGQDRYRVQQGDYRIIYTIHDRDLVVWVVKVGNRKDIYQAREEKTKYTAEKKASKTL